jgi:CspA family cold shock protein
MAKGVIKFYNEDRGYGFIRPDGDSAEVFFHCRNVVGDSELITEGVPVEFEQQPNTRRADSMEAVAVRVLDDPAAA